MSAPAPSPPSHPPARRTISYRALPLWLQWALPFGVAAALLVALIVFVHHENDANQLVDNYNSPSAQVQENQEDTIIVKQQQAPHRFKLAAGLSPDANARLAVVRYMKGQISHGLMDGPITASSCRQARHQPSPLVLTCDVVASVVKYPFDAVVAPAAGTVTYCQVVAPPIPSMKVPVSARCT